MRHSNDSRFIETFIVFIILLAVTIAGALGLLLLSLTIFSVVIYFLFQLLHLFSLCPAITFITALKIGAAFTLLKWLVNMTISVVTA